MTPIPFHDHPIHPSIMYACVVHGLGTRNWSDPRLLFRNPWRTRAHGAHFNPSFLQTRCVRAPRAARHAAYCREIFESGNLFIGPCMYGIAAPPHASHAVILYQFRFQKCLIRVNAGTRTRKCARPDGSLQYGLQHPNHSEGAMATNPACSHTFGSIPPLFFI